MNEKLAVVAVAVLLSGCAVHKEWVATGGSRSDGIVRLSYEVGEFEKPQLDEAQGIRVATQRCAVWGYSGAEPFGGHTRQCNMFGGALNPCAQWMVTREYQCTGNGSGGGGSYRVSAPTPSSNQPPPQVQSPPSYNITTAPTEPGQQYAENARAFLEGSGCQLAQAPVRFKQIDKTSYYEARCTRGRLVHVLCTYGDCRYRTTND